MIGNIYKLQKKARRVMTKSEYNAHTVPLLYQCKILQFEKFILQSKLLFMLSIEYDYAPQSFLDVWTKNNTRDMDYHLRNREQFTLPFVRIELFMKISFISFPIAWNELCDELRFQHNRTSFKIALSDYLFEQLIAA
jgi:hypothetical protein